MGSNSFDVVITSLAAGIGSDYGQVTFVTLPVEGTPQSSFQLTVPLATLQTYEVGQSYTLSLTPAP